MASRKKRRKSQKKERITQEVKQNYYLSLASSLMGIFMVNLFIKAALNNHYLVNVYVDSLVAVFALVIALFQLRFQYQFYSQYHMKKTPFKITISSILLSIILSIIGRQSLDISPIILVLSLFITKKEAEKQWSTISL